MPQVHRDGFGDHPPPAARGRRVDPDPGGASIDTVSASPARPQQIAEFHAFEQADTSTVRSHGEPAGLAIANGRLAMGGDAGSRRGWVKFTLLVHGKPEEGQPGVMRPDSPRKAISLPSCSRVFRGPCIRRRGLRRLTIGCPGNPSRRSVHCDLAENGEAAETMVQQRRRGRTPRSSWTCRCPGWTGVTATRIIRRPGWRQRIPVVAMTANALSKTRRACREAGHERLRRSPSIPTGLPGAIEVVGQPGGAVIAPRLTSPFEVFQPARATTPSFPGEAAPRPCWGPPGSRLLQAAPGSADEVVGAQGLGDAPARGAGLGFQSSAARQRGV